MEYPKDLKSTEAKALLMLADDGTFNAATLNVSPGEAGRARDALAHLGWPVVEFPTEGGPSRSVNDVVYGLRDGSTREQANDEAREAFRSDEFAAWRTKATAAISKSSTAKKAAVRKWSAGDYTGYSGAKLKHPGMNRASFRLLFALMHIREVTPADAEMRPLALVAASNELQGSGWPIEFRTNPVRAAWCDVPDDVLDAWRAAFGTRGQEQAMAGDWPE